MAIAAQLVIALNDDGTVGVNGPIENRMLVFGMMELAKDAINQHAKDSQKRILEVPPGMRIIPTKAS